MIMPVDWRAYLDHVADLEVEHVAGDVSLRVDLDYQVEVPLLENRAEQGDKKQARRAREQRQGE